MRALLTIVLLYLITVAILAAYTVTTMTRAVW
jgi:hypothetical protein